MISPGAAAITLRMGSQQSRRALHLNSLVFAHLRAKRVVAGDDIFRDQPRWRAVHEVALPARVANVGKHLQRHDLLKNLPELVAASQLEEYPCFLAESLPPVKPGAKGALESKIDCR